MAALLAAPAVAPFETADRAVTGDVTVVNIPYRFPDGKIDWLFNPTKKKGPVNHEWLWQLNRMHVWTAMGKAYQATHDEKYARAFAAQLKDWLDQTGGVPPEKDYSPYSPDSPFRTIEEGIRLMGSWPQAWDNFRDSPAFTPALKERFLESMRAQAKNLMAYKTGGNWLLMEMNGVYTFASKFPQFPECAAWRKESAKVFSDALRAQMLPDGLHDELSPDYHSVVFWCAAPLYETAKKYGTVPDLPPDYLDVLRLGAEGPIAMTTPGFTQPRFNDCFTLHLRGLAKCALKYFPERTDFLWAATEGREGEPPKGATASRFLPWAGFAVMRSGWDRNATYLCFDVGPLGMRHAHQDKLSFTLYKGAAELVFDDGGGQYEISPERVYGRSGYDHNTLLVDGLAQVRGEPRRSTKPIDAGWVTTPERDSAFGVYDQGFGPKELRLATHRREIVFDKKADLFTITDTVKSADASNHVYQLLFQLPTTTTEILDGGKKLVARYGAFRRNAPTGKVSESASSIGRNSSNCAQWDLEICVKGGTITTASAQKTPRLAGWFIGRNDRANEPATTVFVTAPKTKDWRFVTTLKPIQRNDQ